MCFISIESSGSMWVVCEENGLKNVSNVRSFLIKKSPNLLYSNGFSYVLLETATLSKNNKQYLYLSKIFLIFAAKIDN